MNRKDGLLALCIAMVLCLCLIPSTMASTEEQNTTLVKDAAQLRIEETKERLGEDAVKEMEDYLEFQRNLPDVVKGMPYSGLAFAATKPEGHLIYMGYIDNFDVSDEEKAEYKAGLQDIWDRYPDKITEDDYPFMVELGPMIEAEAFSVYSPEELEAMRTVDRIDEEEGAAGTIDNNNSIFVDNESEQKIGSVFTGMMAIAVVLLCFYFVRKWK